MSRGPDVMLIFFTVWCGSFSIQMVGAILGVAIGYYFNPLAGIITALIIIVALHWIMLRKINDYR